ncbi:alpha-glucosidase [Scopulibacillus cellulosilyticus]|uniref:Alpha-glucosidase n=1 Tax=Scopulibacillus cellulosilyticus TaxID=2665665 RepID=A0ABW2Q1V7_9BACL
MINQTEKKIFSVNEIDGGFELLFGNLKLMKHTKTSPVVFIGKGEENIEMYRGNFKIEDYLIERIALRYTKIESVNDNKVTIAFSNHSNTEAAIILTIKQDRERLKIEFNNVSDDVNRLWIRINSYQNEKVYGCGEQLSYFNLRGKHFPLWTSEPGVGRNKNTYTTWQADVKDKAGGDYYNTNYPQPTYISSDKYFCHVETTAYADFDFSHEDFHELQVWNIPQFILFDKAETFIDLVKKISDLFGRQPELPDWTYNGIWLGIQGGTSVVEEKLSRALDKGIKVGGVWCQDWQGIRNTSFGKRLMWDWKWNPEIYPELDTKIWDWKKQGIRFLGYINPYVAVDGDLYKTASQKGYLAKNHKGEDYLVDFGEFDCGVVDFTNPEACKWYRQVIKENLIDFGLDGWMADFGEYLPTDVELASAESAKLMHNAWPVLWAKINDEAVREAGRSGDIVYFMRAGYTGTQNYCPLLWAGDQSVNWSLDDGLASVIPAALSSGMCGNGLHHSDIGGYTSLHGNKRTKELFMRWAEMGAFTPVMRTHEGNRPYDCFQFDDDDESLEHLARMTNIYVKLKPYIKTLVKANADEGIPVQRPLFMHYENDEKAYNIQYEYLFGRDLLVAPVYKSSVTEWEVYLPNDQWIHIWTGKEYMGGDVKVNAPIGCPAVFYRKNSPYADLFQMISKI